MCFFILQGAVVAHKLFKPMIKSIIVREQRKVKNAL